MRNPHERVSEAELTAEIVGEFPADYADRFCITDPLGHSAGEWAASSLRGAAKARSAFGLLVWRGVLGFDLARRGAPGTLVGWRVRLDTPDRFELESDGSLMAGRMVFEIDHDQVSWATMLNFHGSTGRRVWAVGRCPPSPGTAVPGQCQACDGRLNP